MVAPSPVLDMPPLDLDEATVAALLDGLIPVYGCWVPWRPTTDFWHTDPLTGAVWAHGAGQRPVYRPGNPTGDVRTLWELNRLQHLVALAVTATRDPGVAPRATERLLAQLRSWYSANPFPWGANHASAMEEALRVIAVAHAFDLVRNACDDPDRQLVTALLVTHAWHIERHVSLYSSAGNHTIAEAVALLYLGALLPEHSNASRWQYTGLRLLRDEGPRQIRADGGSLEQASWYLLFVTELLTLAQALLARTGRPSVPEVDDAVHRATRHLTVLAGGARSAAGLPQIGDADDGRALSTYMPPPWADLDAGKGKTALMPATGIRTTSFEGDDQLLFLCKDFGMAPNFGHSHADLLAVTLRWRGAPVLVDIGTYLYGGPPALRAYFRSTMAHNTVAIDDLDQARQAGPFLWRDPARCRRVTGGEEVDATWDLAWHDGYCRLGIRHWRGVLYLRDSCVAVWDFIAGTRQGHRATAYWHLGSPHPPSPAGGSGIRLWAGPNAHIAMEFHGGSTGRVPSVSQGHRAERYGSLGTCHRVAVDIDDQTGELLTVIRLGDAPPDMHRVHQWVLSCQSAARSAAG